VFQNYPNLTFGAVNAETNAGVCVCVCVCEVYLSLSLSSCFTDVVTFLLQLHTPCPAPCPRQQVGFVERWGWISSQSTPKMLQISTLGSLARKAGATDFSSGDAHACFLLLCSLVELITPTEQNGVVLHGAQRAFRWLRPGEECLFGHFGSCLNPSVRAQGITFFLPNMTWIQVRTETAAQHPLLRSLAFSPSLCRSAAWVCASDDCRDEPAQRHRCQMQQYLQCQVELLMITPLRQPLVAVS
jgi:hypothetical protein